jgi:hypothetical protein
MGDRPILVLSKVHVLQASSYLYKSGGGLYKAHLYHYAIYKLAPLFQDAGELHSED